MIERTSKKTPVFKKMRNEFNDTVT
jgi:hypothetical protein